MTGAELCKEIKEQGLENLEVGVYVPNENFKNQLYPTYRKFRIVGIDDIDFSDGYATFDIDEV